MESQSSVFSEAGPVRWSRSAAVLSTLFLLGTLVAVNCQAQKYTVSKLQTLAGGTYTSVVRMNKAGEVVGGAWDYDGGHPGCRVERHHSECGLSRCCTTPPSFWICGGD